MKLFLLAGLFLLILLLVLEQRAARRDRAALKHVIHVNGTRGKSGVTRLIAAGLTEAGMRVYCKTTGTLPMTIGPDGTETVLHRRGPANISEQLKILHSAAKSGAEVLVIECMAVDPELQYICEHKMLRSDIGVITNARVDHVAEMGDTVEQVCEALCNTVPEHGTVLTADKACFPQLAAEAERLGSRAVLAEISEDLPDTDPFPENLALALAACEAAGADRSAALAGLAKVRRDPYAVSCLRLTGGALFLNGMSANDPESTGLTLQRFTEAVRPELRHRIFILNCRADRAYRTELMVRYLLAERPDEIWLLGKGSRAAQRQLARRHTPAECFRTAEELPLEKQAEGTLIYAIGNIAEEGMALAALAGREGAVHVW